ncbi:hypothetical protein BDZ97DRAFT_1914915 [Flammula alnicola]|nr:hypothetical protein BDZ97DRAFT_1914915 [Flammula alnicola]
MATSFLTPFLRQRVTAQAAGISIVRNILKREEFPNGFTTKQLYRLAVKEPAPQGFEPYPLAPPTQPAQPKRSSKGKNTRKPVVGGVSDVYPPHPDHPIRSVKFLKAHILPNLEGNLEIKMIRQPKSTAKPAEEVEVQQRRGRGNSSQAHKQSLSGRSSAQATCPTPLAQSRRRSLLERRWALESTLRI